MGWFANRKVNKILELRARQGMTEQAAEDALRAIGEEAVEPLVVGLGHGSRDVKMTAIKVLGQLKARPAIEPLLQALADPDDALVDAAALALGAIQDGKAAAPLVAVILAREEPLKAQAAGALEALGGPAVQPILDALAKDDAPGRQHLIATLGKLGDRQAIPALVRRLWDKHKDVRAAATVALRQLGWTAAKPEEQAWWDMATGNWYHCISLGAAALAPLCQAIEDDDYHVRVAVLVALKDKGLQGDRAMVSRFASTLQ